jgi:hypothetical protein
VLPEEFDIQIYHRRNGEETYCRMKINEWKPIPLNGPENPRIRKRKTYICILITGVFVIMLIIWMALGFIRLFLLGDATMLLGSPPLLLIPLGILLKFYFSRKQTLRRDAKMERNSHYRKEPDNVGDIKAEGNSDFRRKDQVEAQRLQNSLSHHTTTK